MGRTGLARRAAARLFLVLRAHRVSSCFQALLLARFVWFALLPPLCKCQQDETAVGEQARWKDVRRRGLKGHSVQRDSSRKETLQSSMKKKIRRSVKEQGPGGVCGKAEARWRYRPLKAA